MTRIGSSTPFHLATLAAATLALSFGAALDEAQARPGQGGRGAPPSVHRGNGGAGGAAAARAHPQPRSPAVSRPGSGGGGRRAEIDSGNTFNRDIDIHNNNNINIDVDRDWDDGWDHHPVAAGVAFGTAAAVTSAVIGSMVYSLPPSGCVTTVYAGIAYSRCGTVWYEPRYAGSSVTYVVVNPPY